MSYPSQDQAMLGLALNHQGEDGQYIAEGRYGGSAQPGVDELSPGYPLPVPFPSPAALNYTYGASGNGNGAFPPHAAYQDSQAGFYSQDPYQ